ncbi:helix-turn-helix domain-containing protein [Microlunatus soli]|uniref:DNA-binding transcriptional regulator, IclR family n=1 Tax=Microlunatus soli TaxID=630515 RepID=A0A1H1YKF2_9ACTN|nr:helix-turn-helix domain-containing protein [Microlunatus soli]SDT21805.1 DNA-binding transcriptional regulator, IclR family [Microlunatus soli]
MAEPVAAEDQSAAVPATTGSQALARGLHILRMLVDEGAPMTATEIARRVGLHQSSVSRILATLSEAGHVRKNDAGRFVPDYGVLALASATTRMPLLRRPRKVFEELIAEHPQIGVSMCMLWRDEMIYLLRARSGGEPLNYYWSGGFPLNISSPALRLLVDLDDADARAILAASRRRHGWGGRPGVAPATEEATLQAARGLLVDDVIILKGWYEPQLTGGAIAIETPEPHPVALALVDDGRLSPERLTVLLHQARRRIERSFVEPDETG